MSAPRITFGLIVLNGEPFLRYALRALYPYAHQIIVVEGAGPAAVTAGLALPDGHSRDATLQTLSDFRRQEDPEGKLEVVTAEDDGHPDGVWPAEKDQQSMAYARRARGDWLWQADVDEMYLPRDIETVIRLLDQEPAPTALSFRMLTFWGGLSYTADGWYLRRGADEYHRLFRWAPGYSYVAHRPPTVVDELGRDLRSLRWLNAAATERLGVHLYHYSLLFPAQVREKVAYYRAGSAFGDWFADAEAWARDSYFSLRRPYHPHNVYRYPSWLQRFDGPQPPQAESMMADIGAGKVATELRANDDVECLLAERKYVAGREALRRAGPPVMALREARWRAAPTVRRAAQRATAAALPHAAILVYHRVAAPAADPQLLCVSPEHFTGHLRVLRDRARCLPLGRLAEQIGDRHVQPGSVTVTFDDGYADNLLNAAPILAAAGVPATVFVTTGGMDEDAPFWWDELERLLLRAGRLPERLALNVAGRAREWRLGADAGWSLEKESEHAGWTMEHAGVPTGRHVAYRELCALLRAAGAEQRAQALDELRAQAMQAEQGAAAGTRRRRLTSAGVAEQDAAAGTRRRRLTSAGDDWRRLTSAGVAELAQSGLVEIGAHTVSHVRLAGLPATVQAAEIGGGKAQLEAAAGRPVTLFSYPYGARADVDDVSVEQARCCGYRAACANEPGVVWRGSHAYRLPRFLVRDWPADEFERRLTAWLGGRGGAS